MTRVLFVCTGNLCRSVLAEYLFRDLAEERDRGRDYQISSAGTIAREGNLAPPETVDVGRALGVDLTPHRARRLTAELIEEAGWVIGMELSHCRAALELVPSAGDRIRLLGQFAQPSAGEVPDPYGRAAPAHRKAAEVILSALPGLLESLEEE